MLRSGIPHRSNVIMLVQSFKLVKDIFGILRRCSYWFLVFLLSSLHHKDYKREHQKSREHIIVMSLRILA
jgi:hypothetical protein